MTPRQLVVQAIERALAAQGLVIQTGSVASGHFVTAPVAVDASELPVLVAPGALSTVAWARAEYRLEMRLSIADTGLLTSGLRVHIRAWPAGAGAVSAQAAGTGKRLPSNRRLEERFMRAVSAETERVAHLFPPEPPEPD